MAEQPKHSSPKDKSSFSKGKTEQKKAAPRKADRGRERQETNEKRKRAR
jgi:hypothetical protein